MVNKTNSVTYKMEWLEELTQLSYLQFTLYTNIYSCNLLDLNIDQAVEWINKYALTSKTKKVKRYLEIKRWIVLAKQYKEILSKFYPLTLSRSSDFVNDIKKSGYLLSKDINDLKSYWKDKLDFYMLDEPSNRSIDTLIDFGRIAQTLGLKNDNYIEFKEVFDLEFNFGYCRQTIELFYTLFNYLRDADINKNKWSYSKYEWPLLCRSLSLWQTWQRCSSTGLDKASYLLDKYLGIKYIHPFFVDRIWIIPHKELTMESDWFRDTDSSHKPNIKNNLTLETCYKILDLDTNASYLTAKLKYKELMKVYHPDINSCPLAIDKAKEITAAWSYIKKYHTTNNI